MSKTTTMPSPHETAASQSAAEPRLWGVLAEYRDVDGLWSAAEKVRDAGYTSWDTHSPFPIHGIEKAMGLPRTILPWIVLIGGITGMLTGLGLVWYANSTSFDVPYALRGYQYVVSGKPVFSLPAKIPPIFELTILFSAFAAVFGMFALNLLPRLHHPLFTSERFKRVTNDRFFISIDARDAKFDAESTRRLLAESGAAAVEEVYDDE